ncbi:MAG: Phenol regulator MopR [Calditrichaeota bacterium]|nr:Phenol regulator MopR [Calditrichota bacterium]
MSATPQDYAKISRREISENVTSRLLRLFPDQSSLIREASRWWLNHDSQAESPPTTTRRFVDVLESFELWLRTPADSERARPRQVRETGSEYNVRRGGRAMTEQFERFLNEYRPFGSELYGDRPHMENQLRELVGETKEWREVINLVRLATLSDVTTMITGEIGTGKETVARIIHRAGSRAAKPFLRIPCSTLSPDDFAEELRNVLERAMVVAGHVIRPEDIRFDRGDFYRAFSVENKDVAYVLDELEEVGFRISGTLPDVLISFLFRMGPRRFRSADLAAELGVAQSTARNYLARLCQLGYACKFGDRKSTTYQAVLEKLRRTGE